MEIAHPPQLAENGLGLKEDHSIMRKLIMEQWMSLDGYISGENDSLDFFTQLTADENIYSDRDQLKFLDSVDTILLGRRTYELFAAFWPEATKDKEVIADKLNQLPKLVVSNTLTNAPWGKWPAAGIINGNAIVKIRQLKTEAGKDIVLWGSITLAQALMREELIDEYHIQLCPVRLGSGRQLFPGDLPMSRLELVDVRKYNTGTVFLNYRF